MRLQLRTLMAVVILGTLFTAGWRGHAQPPDRSQVLPTMPVLSGDDVGFRVDPFRTRERGRIAGTWVVRVNGQWVEPEAVPTVQPVTPR
jgi:hypothetical protein